MKPLVLFKLRLGACRSHGPPSPPMPMVFLMRNYVRVARISPFGWYWDGGRMAMRARKVPDGLVADYSGRT